MKNHTFNSKYKIQEINMKCDIPCLKFLAGLQFVETECRDFILGRNFNFTGRLEHKLISENTLVVKETGKWTSEGNENLKGTGIYRWTSVSADELILEHLRHGEERSAFLVCLIKGDEEKWTCKEPHLCGEDVYVADLRFSENKAELSWNIKGPKKDMRLTARYFTGLRRKNVL